jgi:RNA-directed DNA polymerase
MQESYGEGVAIHTGPESCVVVRKDGCEALTGERTGRAFSRERATLRNADAFGAGGRPHPRHRYREMPRSSARSQTPSTSGHTSCEYPGEPVFARCRWCGGPRREVYGHTPMMYGHGQTDSLVVPTKSPNKTGRPVAEGMEGRGLAKGNSLQHNALRTQGRAGASSGLERVREVAEGDKQVRFTALMHHIYNPEQLRAAYYALKRDAAPGVDGETWQSYGEALEVNLADLSERLKRGAYRAEPVRRAYIAKADGRQRPLGIPTITAYCGVVQYAFRVPHRDAPVPPVGGPAVTDPFRASSSDRSHLYL